jgi:L-glyceraldehyde reductase
MSFGKTITLSNGSKIPQIGLGTWRSKPNEVENAVSYCELLFRWRLTIGCLFVQVEIAVRNGYRHLDLAMVYQNQHEVGAALKKVIPPVVKREELFITSKLWNSGHQPKEVEKQLDETLAQLGIDYLDLYREWNVWN